MPMMNIRKMRVRMRDGQMDVRMRVRLVALIGKVVPVLVVLVVPVPVRMLHPFMRMLMQVPFPHVQPDA